MEQTNAVHIEQAGEMIMTSGSREVGMVGLSFKPGTDDLRESPLVGLAEILIGKGYNLRIYDPSVNLARLMGSNKRFIEETIPHIESLLTDNLAEVIEHADVLVVGQKHQELEALRIAKGDEAVVVIDLVSLDRGQVEDNHYKGICW